VDEPKVPSLAGLPEAPSDLIHKGLAAQIRDLWTHPHRNVPGAQTREGLPPHVVDHGPSSGLATGPLPRPAPPGRHPIILKGELSGLS
jgi:hypothetical protein